MVARKQKKIKGRNKRFAPNQELVQTSYGVVLGPAVHGGIMLINEYYLMERAGVQKRKEYQ